MLFIFYVSARQNGKFLIKALILTFPVTSGGPEPGDFDTYYNYEFENLSIAVYFVDHLAAWIWYSPTTPQP